MQIGYFSLRVVGLTALFTGGALTLQIYADGARFDAQAVVPQIVAIGMVRELGPVLVGLMIAACVTSSIAAKIATMKVTEQIDTLVTPSTNPMTYLTVSRVLGATQFVPIVVGIGDTVDFLEARDILSSLARGAVFGFIAALLGCYHGLQSSRGAAGVGTATKTSVVAILAANVLLTEAFLFCMTQRRTPNFFWPKISPPEASNSGHGRAR